ncbi:MAG: hypothetical protein H7A01_01250 [Hahellaceae bacterium]|jgi:hypothetical protein|nr:hypothetical protein [Hahellaceae bacterium]MCP5210929.1 hypothetical protein [Hahellaceae bacterium]
MTHETAKGEAPELNTAQEEQRQVNILFGSYADILFVLLPFVVVGIFKLWQSDIRSILLSYDIAMASAVLGGLAVVKFIVGLLVDPVMLNHKEKLVFLISGTVFAILVPSLLFSVMIMLSNPVPNFVMFVQPLLLVLAIMAYTGAVASTNVLADKQRRQNTSAK